MAITITQLMTVAGDAAIQAAGKPYILGDVLESDQFDGYYVRLFDPQTGHHISIQWTTHDDLINKTENSKIALVRSLILNGIRALDLRIERDVVVDDPADDVVNDGMDAYV